MPLLPVLAGTMTRFAPISSHGAAARRNSVLVSLFVPLLEFNRSLKTEPNRSLLASVRDERFKQLRICVSV